MKKNRDFDIGISSCVVYKMVLTMKILTCLLIFGLSTVSARSLSQERFSVSLENATLTDVFKEITRITNYEFIYSSNELSRFGKVSVNVTNQELEKILAECLKHTDLWYVVENRMVVISPKIGRPAVPQKTVIVRGVVRDSKNNTLPGVTVLIKGTKIGVTTDESGNFQIPVPEPVNMILQFSFVGMQKLEMPVKDVKPLKVVMEDEVTTMDEVVVNGIFTQNKNSFTGSVTSIKGDELLSVSNTNLIKALAILSPGLRIVENNEQGSNPNNVPEIIIRGMTSIASQGELGLNRPLIIMDGVEISLERLYDMDIYEIERVDVLKDASATSIYGEKAANGVIVVERKKVTDKEVKVRYNFVPKFDFPDVKSYHYCDAAQKLELERLSGLYDSADGSLDESYNQKFKRVAKGVNTDWMSKALRNSRSFSHSISITGRGSGMDYGITARLSDAKGVMKADSRYNYGVGFYFSYRLVNKLTITYRSDFSKTDSKNSPYGSFSEYVKLNPYDSPKDDYGEWVKRLSYDVSNPLYDATTSSFNKSKSKSISNSLNLRWDILKGIYITANGNYTLNDTRSDAFLSPELSQFEKETDPTKRGSYTINGSEGNSWSTQLTLNYSKGFDADGTVLSLHAGGNMNKNTSSSFGFSGLGFLKGNLTDISFANGYPQERPSGGETLNSAVGVFANLNFILLNRYFVDGSYRVSGSSKFGKDRRFAPFWSVGLGWNVHNEQFFKDLGFVNLFRVRGSMGYTGSVNFADNQAVTTYRYDQKNGYYTGLGANPITMGNENLKWQTTINYNAGLTMSLLQERLDVNFDIYKQLTKDLLLSITVPPSVGVASVSDNLGETGNWGYEWSVSGMLLKNAGMYWRLGLSGHHTENKLKKISNALKRQNDKNMKELGVAAPKIQLEEGESATGIYSVPSLGINPANGSEVFVKKDGSYTFKYDPTDKVCLGETTPYFEGALTTSFGYKGFSVSAAMSFTFGGDIYNSTRAQKVERIKPRENVDVRAFTERWKNPGDIVHYTTLSSNNNAFVHSQRFIEQKNELYLSSLNFSYELKPEWVRKVGLKRLSVGVGFSEVLRITSVKYERGTTYPYSRGYNFTISPTF